MTTESKNKDPLTQPKGDSEISAINVNLKTRDEVRSEFSDNLGFDPGNLDTLSQQLANPDSDEALSNAEHVQHLIELQQDMSEMLLARFKNNMQAFQRYMPEIYEKFKDYTPSEPLEFLCTSNGVPNLFFPERNEFFYKVYDPVDLCNRQVDIVLKSCPFKQLNYNRERDILGQIHHRYLNEMVEYQEAHLDVPDDPLVEDSCPIAIILGCGLGYHLGYLYEKVEIGNLILIEPNVDLFFASLHSFDWANLLDFINAEHRGIYLMVGQTKEQVFEDLNVFYERHGRMLAGFMWSMIHYRSTETTAIADQLIKDYERTFATLGFIDDHFFGLSHGCYLASHHSRFVRYSVDIPEKFRDIPLCIVANGPSLSHDLPLLRKIQDKVFIMACGTAIETLYNAGIQPTFYAVTERLKVVSEHLSIIPDKDYLSKIILVGSDVIHPEVAKMFKHQAIFGKSDETFFCFIAGYLRQYFEDINGICLMNPLVGNMGVASATQFKFKHLYLFGVDNGTKRADLAVHPDENIFYKNEAQKFESRTEYLLKGLTYTAPGNFGGTVATSYLYKLSARYMEVVIKNNLKTTEFFNCSDGSMLEGAIPTHSEDLGFLKDLPPVDFDEFIKFMDEKKTFSTDGITEEYAKSLFKPETFDFVVDKIISLLTNKERPKTRLEYVFLLQNVCEIFTALRQSRDFYIADLLDGSIYNLFVIIVRVLYLTKDVEQAIKFAEDELKIVLNFLDDCKRIFRFLPYYYAEDHHKFLNGKVGFDHPDSPAPSFTPRKPYVTQKDRDNYPTRKFVKRYE